MTDLKTGGIRGREKEVGEIHEFITSKIKSRNSGILYVTGPPGTGKSMSIHSVLDQIKTAPKLSINCLQAQSSKAILSNICRSVGLDKFTKCNESEMISRLSKKFTCRTCETHIIVLDEMDQLPKSRNVDLIRTIFSWPKQSHSKLILIGIANTVNLASRYQAMSSIFGKDYQHFTKIIFKPYNALQIKSILEWYLDNDENYEDAKVDPKAVTMISAKFAKDNGDIRGALNALKSAIEDTNERPDSCDEFNETTIQYPTPPSTPPATPCKDKTNLSSLVNSIKKRQRLTSYIDDAFPFTHQIILTCLIKLSAKTKGFSIDSKLCERLISMVLLKFDIRTSLDDYRAMLDNLETQGLIAFKKGRPREKIVLRASETELNDLVQRKDMIMSLIDTIY